MFLLSQCSLWAAPRRETALPPLSFCVSSIISFPLLFFLLVSSLVFRTTKSTVCALGLLICSWEAQPVRSARQLDVSLACVGKPGLSDLMRGCTRFTMLEKKELFTCLLFLCFFSPLSLTSLFRSELLDVRMLSTGKIRWCLWAPLVLLALVSSVPSKAQDMGKCSPPPLLLFLFQTFILHPPCPQVIRSQSPLIFTLHHSPLLFSPPLISLPPLCSISTSSRCLMCRLTPLRLHDRVPTVSPKSFARLHTSEGCNAYTFNGFASYCDRAANAKCSHRLCLDTLTQ